MSENLPLKPCKTCPIEIRQNCWNRCLKYYQWIKLRKEGNKDVSNKT
jgi:hypothetical protein